MAMRLIILAINCLLFDVPWQEHSKIALTCSRAYKHRMRIFIPIGIVCRTAGG